MPRQAGFTLVELVMVIVLLGIVATVSVQFVALSTVGALDVSSRQQRALQSVVISEQITREVREAFPLSVRANGQCLEWLPVIAATSYDALTTGPDFDEVSIVPFGRTVPAGARLIVYGYGSAQSDLYGSENPGPVSPPIEAVAANAEAVTLSQSHRFRERSPQKRLYAVEGPVSICQINQWLYRFSDYARSESQPTANGLNGDSNRTREVMSANLVASSLSLKVVPPSLRRAAVVNFAFELVSDDGNETTNVSQEVQIRNVP
ncbi:type II secretion system protein [Marinobacter halophilus]|uniref:Prepilin-type cleavage/methylation domain-containing protein n=1 Tax=Marinobacter halophilus TaxID=1323740 RepID=A0A2T1KH60_9GAMM|nr:type II secretion system protein [Marinobacter halophilus]PSF09083.1 prepilin-type cleavage/methylation domain-containing protein [Marinobacter halophilus]GGC83561.1 MSHA biogenesis protein MshO [Marinobacter halophilus]